MERIRFRLFLLLPCLVWAGMSLSACESAQGPSTGLWNRNRQALELVSKSQKVSQKSIVAQESTVPHKVSPPSPSGLIPSRKLGSFSQVDSKRASAPPQPAGETDSEAAKYSFWNPNPEPYVPYRNPFLTQAVAPSQASGEFVPSAPSTLQKFGTPLDGQAVGSVNRGGGLVVPKGLQGTGSQTATLAVNRPSDPDPVNTAPTNFNETANLSGTDKIQSPGLSATNHADVPPQEADEPVEKTTIAKLTQESGDPSLASPDGTMGSKPATVVLPGFDALIVTLSGQPKDVQNIPPMSLDWNVWYLAGSTKQYLSIATMQYFHWQIFEAKTSIPSHPDCKQETLDNGQIKVTCQGPFPLPSGHMLRLITCGVPNMEVIRNVVGNVENPLAEFVDRAWVRGKEESLLDFDVCPERRYVDYVFYGAEVSELQLVFPLEENKLAFLVQFPPDYLDHLDSYLPPIPNHLGIHNLTYSSNRLMGRFLKEGRIVQAIYALPTATILGQNVRMPEFINYLYSSPPSATGGKILEGMPGNEVCLALENWDPSWVVKETALFYQINKMREQGGDCGSKGHFSPAPPVDMEPTLRCAARFHSKDMNEQNFFSHTNKYGQLEGFRIWLAAMLPVLPGGKKGILFSQTGEVIARGGAEPQLTLQEWLGSEEHCAHLLNPNFTHVGIGYHPGGSSGDYWTSDFGAIW